MLKDTEKQIIRDFLHYYFQNRKSQILKKEVPQFEILIQNGVLLKIQDNEDILELEGNSIALQSVLLEIAIEKLARDLPNDISEAFHFINEFDDVLRKEHNCSRVINSFSKLIRGMLGYVLYVLNKRGIDVKSFLLSLDENREHHLYPLERSFFKFLHFFDYSEFEIFEMLDVLWDNETKRTDIITGLRELPFNSKDKSKELLKYAYENDKPLHFTAELLIGIYNSGETSAIEKIIKLKDKDLAICLGILGRIKYKNKLDVEKAFSQIGEAEVKNNKLASQQSYLIRNIIECEHTTDIITRNAFKLYSKFIQQSENKIKERVFHDISFIKDHEKEKYSLLHLYLSETTNFKIIRSFFHYFKNPVYIFDLMIRLFQITPNYRFSMSLFEDSIRHSWNTNKEETEQQVLYLFKHDPKFGVLGVKIILIGYHEILQVDLLKLDKAKYQVNAINSICNHPHSFDKLLHLILPLRNSKFREVRENLQKNLADKVFNSYHERIYNQIENNIGKNKKDKRFIQPIKKALEDYFELKKIKESINDLNPYENESDLMDLYYRLEHEKNAKSMDEIRHQKGTFMETMKNSIIVRGNSFKFDEKTPTPLAKIERSMLIDGSVYLNPDLYEHNLNNIE